MIFSLAALREAPRVFDRELPLPELRDDEGAPLLAGPASVRGRFEPAGSAVALTMRVEARLDLRCARCLARFTHDLDVDVELEVVGPAEAWGAPEVRVDEDDAALWYADGDAVDLSQIVGEQVHLNLPLKPVCTPECRGLCPSCGADRNRIECGCRPADLDPRLAPLLRLRELDRTRSGS
jgi:uncharacterized protein